MSHFKLTIAFFSSLLLIVLACSTPSNKQDISWVRLPSGQMGVSEVPPGLQGEDLFNFNHLSEGAEIYPYEWLIALKSAKFPDAEKKITQPYLNSLDWKYGLVRDDHPNNPSVMNYVGLTAAWSNHPVDQSEAKKGESDPSARPIRPIVRNVNGVKSIRMVGTNCALCHTGSINMRGKEYVIPGAPNMVNVRAFFQDMAISTLAVLAKEELTDAFLKEFGVPDSLAVARKLNAQFMAELGEDTSYIKGLNLGKRSGQFTLLTAKLMAKRDRLFRGDGAIARGLERLLKVTYGFSDSDNIGELKNRMQFFGKLMVGTDPKNNETISGFARTDAFGRIGNLVLRGDNPIDYTAPVSLPWIWSIKYQSFLHYTANTNSVMLRNVGQSLGLGAIILDEKKGKTTVNVHNLDRLERLVHKIQVPEWNKVFAGTNLLVKESDLENKNSLVSQGRAVYQNNCMECHTANAKRVGPANALLDYKLIPLNKIETDKMAALNCVKPIDNKKFEDIIFASVTSLKSNFYTEHGIDPKRQAEMEFQALRGSEFFRDTYNGFSRQRDFGSEYGNIEAGQGYQARHLSGVWATAPYLHNGSVPNMWELLKKASDRPKIFNVQSREYDLQTLGFDSKRQRDIKGRVPACAKDEEKCFDTAQVGNSNTGHEYGSQLSDTQKRALIEYLKILPPEDEYAWESSKQ